jgi:hypothetical protein
MAIKVMVAVVASTCAAPSPKIDRRNTHNLEGCSSRPITNSSITTPSSEMLSTS